MALPQNQPAPNEMSEPKTVLGAKIVDLALVTFTDETGQQHTTLAIVGDNKVHLLEGRSLGLGRQTTPQGLANKWLTEGIFKKLGKTK